MRMGRLAPAAAVLLSLLLTAASAAASGSAATTSPAPNFADVSANYWAYAAISQAYGAGWLQGVGETADKAIIIAPDQPVTRAEFVTLLARSTGQPLPNEQTWPQYFVDVPPTSWAYSYVELGAHAAQPIIQGMGADMFVPDAAMTREQVTAILARIGTAGNACVVNKGTPPFTDMPSVAWAQQGITTAWGFGFISGVTATTFAPVAMTTRAQAVVLLERIAASATCPPPPTPSSTSSSTSTPAA